MSQKTNWLPVRFSAGIGWGVLGVLFFITFCSTIAFADGNEQLNVTLPVYTGRYDMGVVTLGSFGRRGEATSLMKIPENAEIVAAYVYMSGYSNLAPGQLGDIMVTVSNGDTTITVPATCIGYSQEGANQSFTYRADATGVVSPGEKLYHVQGYTLPQRPSSGFLYGGGMIAIYRLPNLPECSIWIADGLDYFNANDGLPTTKTVSFQFDGNRYERYGSVKLFSGFDNRSSGASAIWYQLGSGMLPTGDIMDAPYATDYDNSSSADPNVDTDPLDRGTGDRMNWAMAEFMVPVQSEQDWAAFQLESQVDNPNKQPYSGVWNMIAFKLPFEETGCGSIGDQIFYDKNADGVKDWREAGIPTVLVSLYRDNGDNILDVQADTLVDSVRTNRLGYYLFQNLKAGSYFVDIDHPYLSDTSVVLTTNNDPAGPIQVVDCSEILDIDFGVTFSGQLPYTPVQFNSFNFQSDTNGVWINWSTQAGTENLGFDIFRSITEFGDYSLINPDVIPAFTGQGGVHNYSFFDADVEPGQTYYYKIADVNLSGEANVYGPVQVTPTVTDVAGYEAGSHKPEDYFLGDAYPNPFNGTTAIQLYMAKPGLLRLEVYNLLGQKIRTLVSGTVASGSHLISWDGTDDLGKSVGSGVYFYRMKVNNFRGTKRILYLK